MKTILIRPVLIILCFALASAMAHGGLQPKLKQEVKTIAAIRAVLDAQAAAWNRGDIEGYMAGYDRSPNTVFVSGDRINRGWQAVLDRYKKSYDSREKMGLLTFSDLEITILSKDAALVLGRWRLKRAKDEPHGTFSLLFGSRKRAGRLFTTIVRRREVGTRARISRS